MIKYSKLRQKLIKEGAIAAGAIFVFGGLALGLSSYVSQQEQELQGVQSNLQSTISQISELERKRNIIASSANQFKDLKAKIDNGYYELDPIIGQEKLKEFSKDFRLKESKVDFSTENTLNFPLLQNHPAVVASNREVTFSFNAMTDLHVYGVINALQTTFPGIVKIREIQLKRLRNVDKSIIGDFWRGEEPDLVQARINFLWIGLRFKEEATGVSPNGA
jgi:hypothetical protein